MKNFIVVLAIILIVLACEKPNNVSDQSLYLKACQLIRENNLVEAKKTLLKLIQNFPDSKFSLEANEKLDEIYLVSRKNDEEKLKKSKENASSSKSGVIQKFRNKSTTKEKIIDKERIDKDLSTNPMLKQIYRKPTREEEITALILFSDALFEEKNGNKDQAQALLRRIISLYPLSIASSYAEVHLKSEKLNKIDFGASLHLYRNMLSILENSSDHTKRKEKLSKLSTANVSLDVLSLHKALLEYCIDVDSFLQLLAEEKQDLTKKNLAHFANSHFVMKDVEWSKKAYSKMIMEKNHIVSHDNSSSHNKTNNAAFDFGLKSQGGFLSFLSFGHSNKGIRVRLECHSTILFT